MKRSIKASLLSALVFPGAGHFYVRRPIRGAILMVIAVICLLVMFSVVWEAARTLSSQLQANRSAENVTSQMVQQHIEAVGGRKLSVASTVLFVCWMLGIVDSFRIGALPKSRG